MKKIVPFLKILVPLALGVFLVWYMYDSLSDKERQDVFSAFGKANYFFLVLSFIFGLMAHLSRAIRWRYMFEPLGKNIGLWNSFNAIMAGYFINLLAPRAGEPARAGFISNYEDVPFEKSFGTIVAERVIDLAMLGIIVLITLFLQFDKLDQFKEILSQATGNVEQGKTHWFTYVTYLIAAVIVIVVILSIFHKGLRTKVIKLLMGMWEGLKSIFKLKKRKEYLGHTLLIWLMYLMMFGVCYQAIEDTSSLGLGAMLAGFVAGTIGVILVQGGLGIYPIFVGAAITLYIGASPGSDSVLNLNAYALGWLIWLTQIVLIIPIGILSLILMPIQNKDVER
ncbi:MAG: flippase-like domain-containing protein [Flavobacteriales bacterium]|nr:flippase-like domain-containing protein [Flavobacteriales bacterium]